LVGSPVTVESSRGAQTQKVELFGPVRSISDFRFSRRLGTVGDRWRAAFAVAAISANGGSAVAPESGTGFLCVGMWGMGEVRVGWVVRFVIAQGEDFEG
jgi:hypothetical protein